MLITKERKKTSESQIEIGRSKMFRVEEKLRGKEDNIRMIKYNNKKCNN